MTDKTPQQLAREALKVITDLDDATTHYPDDASNLYYYYKDIIRTALTRMADESMVYVPNEPTEGMLFNVCKDNRVDLYIVREIYSKMIAAASDKGE